jgi:hypothetical protein
MGHPLPKAASLKKLQEVLRELKAEFPAFPAVKITYYIVGKRHHIR